jgi:hypothetical protein
MRWLTKRGSLENTQEESNGEEFGSSVDEGGGESDHAIHDRSSWEPNGRSDLCQGLDTRHRPPHLLAFFIAKFEGTATK